MRSPQWIPLFVFSFLVAFVSSCDSDSDCPGGCASCSNEYRFSNGSRSDLTVGQLILLIVLVMIAGILKITCTHLCNSDDVSHVHTGAIGPQFSTNAVGNLPNHLNNWASPNFMVALPPRSDDKPPDYVPPPAYKDCVIEVEKH